MNAWEREFEREIDRLEAMLDRGEITEAEYRDEVRAMERDYRDYARAEAEERAQEAYDAEMGRWW